MAVTLRFGLRITKQGERHKQYWGGRERQREGEVGRHGP